MEGRCVFQKTYSRDSKQLNLGTLEFLLRTIKDEVKANKNTGITVIRKKVYNHCHLKKSVCQLIEGYQELMEVQRISLKALEENVTKKHLLFGLRKVICFLQRRFKNLKVLDYKLSEKSFTLANIYLGSKKQILMIAERKLKLAIKKIKSNTSSSNEVAILNNRN